MTRLAVDNIRPTEDGHGRNSPPTLSRSTMPDPLLRDTLQDEDGGRAERKRVRFAINEDGKIECFHRDFTEVGVGRTRLMAFLDWEEKVETSTPTED